MHKVLVRDIFQREDDIALNVTYSFLFDRHLSTDHQPDNLPQLRFPKIESRNIIAIAKNRYPVSNLLDFLQLMRDVDDANSLCFQLPNHLEKNFDLCLA